MSIYADVILDHFRNPQNNHLLKKPTRTIEVNNPLCGDTMTMQIRLEKNKIVEIGFLGNGCAISQAGASMITQYIKGKNVKELRKFDKDSMIDLLGIELTPNRLKCGLLAWEAVQKLIQ